MCEGVAVKPVCQISHSQILSGTCPWCEQPVGDDADAGAPVWSLPAMAAALDDPDDAVRNITISNLRRNGPPVEQAVPLLSKALAGSAERTRKMAGHALDFLGSELSAEQVEGFEAQIPTSPHELAIRILALGFYFLGHRKSDGARQARRPHIFCLIQNAPECDTAGRPPALILEDDDAEGYAHARKLWLAQVDSHP